MILIVAVRKDGLKIGQLSLVCFVHEPGAVPLQDLRMEVISELYSPNPRVLLQNVTVILTVLLYECDYLPI